MISLLKHQVQNIKNKFDPSFDLYLKEKESFPSLDRDTFGFYSKLSLFLGNEWGNPISINQISDSDFYTKQNHSIRSSIHIHLKSIEDWNIFFETLKKRMQNNSFLSLGINGNLFIFCKYDNELKVNYSYKVNLNSLLEQNINLICRKVFNK